MEYIVTFWEDNKAHILKFSAEDKAIECYNEFAKRAGVTSCNIYEARNMKP